MPLLLALNKNPFPAASSKVAGPQQPKEERTIPAMDTPTHHNTHDHYWSNAKKDAAERMAQIIHSAKPSTEAEVHAALAHCLRHRSPGVTAEMMMLVNTWQQACHELHEHTA